MSKFEIDLFTNGHTHIEHPEFGTQNFAEIWDKYGLKWSHKFDGPGGGATVYFLEGDQSTLIKALEDAHQCTHTPGDWNCPVDQAICCAKDVNAW